MALKIVVCLIAVMIVFEANAQRTKEEVIGRLMTDQKKWQQSKMPATVFYKDNYAYKIPKYNPGSNFLYNHSDQHIMSVVKTNINLNYTMPVNNVSIMSFSDSVVIPWSMQYLKNKQLFTRKYSTIKANSSIFQSD